MLKVGRSMAVAAAAALALIAGCKGMDDKMDDGKDGKDGPKISKVNFDKVKDGMSPAEVEAILGPFSGTLPPPKPQVDVMFVLDVTGSMTKEIHGVRDGIV